MQSQWSQQQPQQSSYEYRAQPEMYDMNYYDGASSQSTIRFGMGTSEDFRQGSSSTSQKRRFYDKENVGSSFNNNNINPRQQQRPQWGGMQNDNYYSVTLDLDNLICYFDLLYYKYEIVFSYEKMQLTLI